MSDKQSTMASAPLEDDDSCSEFSVISVYDDDQDDVDSVHGSANGNAPRIGYKEPSVHESEFVDNSSVCSHEAVVSTEAKSNASGVNTDEMPRSTMLASWNPMALSGYVPETAVAELVDKVLKEYKQNHELLSTINSSIVELKDARSAKNESDAIHNELQTLKADLAKSNARVHELEVEKQTTEQQFKSTAKNAEHYILRLESQLEDQCRMNKALREELDERMDELRATRLELSTQRTIVATLLEENSYNAEEMSRVREDYENQLKTLEKTASSYYERNEKNCVSNQPTQQLQFISPIYKSENLTCKICQCDCPSRSYFDAHMRNHNPYKCDRCDYSTEYADHLSNHLRDHENVGSSSTRKSSVSSSDSISVGKADPVPEPLVYKCGHCDFTSIYETQLEYHTNEHLNVSRALAPLISEPAELAKLTKEADLIQTSLQTSEDCDINSEYEHQLEYSTNEHSETTNAPPSNTPPSSDDGIATPMSELTIASIIESMVSNDSISDAEEVMSGFTTPAESATDLISYDSASVSIVREPSPAPVAAKPLPLYSPENLIQHQIFVCDCFHAFPSRGTLLSHQAHCHWGKA